MKNRIIALSVVFLIVFQMFFVISPSASESAESSVVKLLDALDIMTLDQYTGNFWDETPVERREMAQIICNLFRFDVKADEVPRFKDVQEKNRAYVETAVRNGYMTGYSPDQFGPEDYVTYEQLVKIFVSVLGADGLAENMGGYPSGYVAAGRKLGISGRNLGGGTTVARRIDVANIIYDTMNAGVVTLTGASDGEVIYSVNGNRTFLTEIMDIYRYTGIVEKNEATSVDDFDGLGNGLVQIDGNIYSDPKHLADDYIGCNVNVYVFMPSENVRGEIIFIEEYKDNETIILTENDIIGVNKDAVEYYEENRTKKLEISPVIDMIYNGKALDFDIEKIKVKNGFVKFIDNNDDNEFDVVSVTEYETYVVDHVDESNGKISVKFDKPSLDVRECFLRVYRDGTEITLGGIGRGDVALVAVSEGSDSDKAVRIDVCSKYVIGTVERISSSDGDTYITINGNKLRVSDYCEEVISKGKLKEIKIGECLMIYLDSLGKIAYFSNNSQDGNVGYLIDSAVGEKAFDSSLFVKIYTLDGKIELFGTENKVRVDEEKVAVTDIVKDAILMGKFNTPQLVKYSEKGGVLSEIRFAVDGYDAIKFSKDVSSGLLCTNISVLAEKYYVSANTRVFYVPSPAVDEEDYYNLYTGSYFTHNGTYTAELYEIDEMGNVGYAVVFANATWNRITEGSPILAVSEVHDGLDSDGNEIKVIKGMNENGVEVEVESAETESVIDSSLNREVVSGDVIQYGTNFSGKIIGVKILKHEQSEYFEPVLIHTGTGSSTKKVYGEIMRGDFSNLLIYCGNVYSDMAPTLAHKNVANTGQAVYEYDEVCQEYRKIEFDEIEHGDRVFACVNAANRTRMLIVYKRGE